MIIKGVYCLKTSIKSTFQNILFNYHLKNCRIPNLNKVLRLLRLGIKLC